MLARDELAAWLRLLESPGFGWDSARQLLSKVGTPQAAFELSPADQQAWLSPKQQDALREPPAHLDEQVEKTWDWLQADPAHQIMVLGDADYPDALLQTADPPAMLYLHGRRELLGAASLAVVGSRSPTPQGRDNAEAFSKALSEAGLAIISGLALGVDGAAHQGALAGAGSTIAVVGTGLDQIYPKRHKALAAAIAEQGLIISEYSLGMPPLSQNFPRRNRIIAGLSQGCLVVEAALKSGSLITARLASEAGREVFAIPGSIHSPLSRGCHALIRQGAKLVESAADILEELPSLKSPPAAPEAAPTTHNFSLDQMRLLERMGYDPISLDGLQARCGWSAADLSAALLELEMVGAVARLPGQMFQRRALG
ncbi:DNA-processing protein DprA [soil metagenome]